MFAFVRDGCWAYTCGLSFHTFSVCLVYFLVGKKKRTSHKHQ